MKLLDFGLERDELSDRFGGGLPRGSLVVMEGKYGAGKSILSERLAYGLVERGASASLVSTELTTAGFLDQMESLDYAVELPLLEERLVFIPVHPLLGARAPKQDLLRRVLRARRMYEKDVIVFDCFSKFLADHERSGGREQPALDQVEAVLYLFKRLNSMGKTIVLTFETGQVGDEYAAIFKESADLFMSLEFELVGNTAARRIVVNRLSRAQGRFGDIIGFRVEPGIGIVIEIKSVV